MLSFVAPVQAAPGESVNFHAVLKAYADNAKLVKDREEIVKKMQMFGRLLTPDQQQEVGQQLQTLNSNIVINEVKISRTRSRVGGPQKMAAWGESQMRVWLTERKSLNEKETYYYLHKTMPLSAQETEHLREMNSIWENLPATYKTWAQPKGESATRAVASKNVLNVRKASYSR